MRTTCVPVRLFLAAAFCFLAQLTACGEEKSVGDALLAAIRSTSNLDDALRAAYYASHEFNGKISLTFLKKDLESRGGGRWVGDSAVGRIEMLVAEKAFTLPSGVSHDLAIDISFDFKSDRVIWMSPVLNAVISQPQPYRTTMLLYPEGSATRRALALPYVQKGAKRYPLVVGLSISYKYIWPTNPSEGPGYDISVEMNSRPRRSPIVHEWQPTLGAFDLSEPVYPGEIISDMKGKGTKLLRKPGFDVLAEPGFKPVFMVTGLRGGTHGS